MYYVSAHMQLVGVEWISSTYSPCFQSLCVSLPPVLPWTNQVSKQSFTLYWCLESKPSFKDDKEKLSMLINQRKGTLTSAKKTYLWSDSIGKHNKTLSIHCVDEHRNTAMVNTALFEKLLNDVMHTYWCVELLLVVSIIWDSLQGKCWTIS